MLNNKKIKKGGIIAVIFLLTGALFFYLVFFEIPETPTDYENVLKNQKNDYLPIIYSKNYNITFLGLEQFHAFDSTKYKKIYDDLASLREETGKEFYTSAKLPIEKLKTVHSDEYFDKLKKPKNLARYLELGVLQITPHQITQNRVLDPMLYATGGTLVGMDLAREYGYAINLSGGYHHAAKDEGGGFNVYSDIAIAVEDYLGKNSGKKVMIVDLDAHQGNGYARIFENREEIVIFDVYNQDIFPKDEFAKKFIDYDFAVSNGIRSQEYLNIIDNQLPKAIAKESPDFIIYNAGSDVLKTDPLGQMKLDKEAVVKRDELVFSYAEINEIPVLMLLSGGYSEESLEVVGESILNLVEKFGG